jgi:putative SOS response-associated peptidase YedK
LQKYSIYLQSDLTDIADKSKYLPLVEKILIIYKQSEVFTLTLSNLGLKYSSKSPRIFNSRIETIKKKQNWLELFSNSRILVPMSGFYEWKITDGQKVPYRIFIPGEELFFVAAVFNTGNDGNFFSSLITTKPNNFIKPLHNRMPVIFRIQDGIKFLNAGEKIALDMCIPFEGNMEMEKVQ